MLLKHTDYLRVELNCFEIFGGLKQLGVMGLAPSVMDSGT